MVRCQHADRCLSEANRYMITESTHPDTDGELSSGYFCVFHADEIRAEAKIIAEAQVGDISGCRKAEWAYRQALARRWERRACKK